MSYNPGACPITGMATITLRAGEARWDRTDESIHVAQELVDSATPRQHVEERYRIGDRCPYADSTFHAYLKETA